MKESNFKKIKAIHNQWREFAADKNNSPLLQFDKYKLAEKQEMIYALMFWYFIRQRYIFGHDENPEANEYKRQFLQSIIDDKTNSKLATNVLVQIIARIEMLPTSVWRKLLWKENIDFQSFEALLRRLEEKQIAAIRDNWADLYIADRMPRVFKRALRDKVSYSLAYLFRIQSNKKLLQEDLFDSDRYMSKSAWAYSLMGLDFGFGKYPNGLTDDTKIKDRNPSRFLSRKNHVNDFVVDMEFGKYWQMYKTARKNFVWKSWSSKEVHLKPYVCPGFWHTLFMHLLFWIICPLLFINGITNFLMTDHLNTYNVIMMSLGLLTPLWIVFAAMRLIVTIVIHLVVIVLYSIKYLFKKTKYGTKLVEYVAKQKEKLIDWWDEKKGSIGVMGLSILALMIILGIYIASYAIIHQSKMLRLLTDGIVPLLFATIVIVSIVMSIYETNQKEEEGIDYFWTPRLWALTVTQVIVMLFITFMVEINENVTAAYHFVADAVITSIEYVQVHFTQVLLYTASLASLIIIFRPLYFSVKWNEEKYNRSMKHIPWQLGVCLLIIMVIGIIRTDMSDIHFGETLTQYGGSILLFFLGTTLLGYPLIWYFTRDKMRKENLDKRNEILQIKVELAHELYKMLSFYDSKKADMHMIWCKGIIEDSLWINEWMYANRNTSKPAELIKRLSEMTHALVYNKIGRNEETYIYARQFIKNTLFYITPQIVDQLDENFPIVRKYEIDSLMDFLHRLRTTGNVKKAYESFKPEYEKKQQLKYIESAARKKRRENLWKFWNTVVTPFTFVWRRASNMVKDVRKTAEVLNEYCPHINQSQNLN